MTLCENIINKYQIIKIFVAVNDLKKYSQLSTPFSLVEKTKSKVKIIKEKIKKFYIKNGAGDST